LHDEDASRNVPELSIVSTKDLSRAARKSIVLLCTRAFDRDFTDLFTFVVGSMHVLVHRDRMLIGRACWATRWLQPEGYTSLRTAYVDAVATDPAVQGRGVGSAIILRLMREIQHYDLGGLSTPRVSFYARLGWERWHGPTAMQTENGLIPTPDDTVMVLRTRTTPPLDTTTRLIVDYRAGQAW
jgi:aminoglycoside 2'-N-acetyltransferase I